LPISISISTTSI